MNRLFSILFTVGAIAFSVAVYMYELHFALLAVSLLLLAGAAYFESKQDSEWVRNALHNVIDVLLPW